MEIWFFLCASLGNGGHHRVMNPLLRAPIFRQAERGPRTKQHTTKVDIAAPNSGVYADDKAALLNYDVD